jgi:2-oxoglutarate ferredoxin oxidoreductase subunit beta
VLRLRKLHADYDPSDRLEAIRYLHQRHSEGEIVTGLLYVEPDAKDLHDYQNTVEKPLNRLSDGELVPGAAALEKINASLR